MRPFARSGTSFCSLSHLRAALAPARAQRACPSGRVGNSREKRASRHRHLKKSTHTVHIYKGYRCAAGFAEAARERKEVDMDKPRPRLQAGQATATVTQLAEHVGGGRGLDNSGAPGSRGQRGGNPPRSAEKPRSQVRRQPETHHFNGNSADAFGAAFGQQAGGYRPMDSRLEAQQLVRDSGSLTNETLRYMRSAWRLSGRALPAFEGCHFRGASFVSECTRV